jgi:outer membrane protein assembly factor BamB
LPLGVLLVACGAGSVGGKRLQVEAVPAARAEPPIDGWNGDRLVSAAEGAELTRVAPDGAVRWRVAASGWVVRRSRDEVWTLGDNGHHQPVITRIDGASGKVLSTALGTDTIGSWVVRDGALYHADSYAVARVDPATGQDVWRVRGDFVEYDAQAAPSAFWVRCKAGVCGFRADSGAPIATLPPASWPMLTPDGGALVLQSEHAADIYDAATGQRSWSAAVPAGERVNKTAVTDRWVAVLSDEQEGEVDHLRVFARGGGDAVWSVASKPGKYLEYIAAGGDLVVWYDSGNAAIHAVRLPDGARARVFQLHETFVMSTDATGTAPAVPDHAPEVIGGDIVVVTHFDQPEVFLVH